MEMTNDNSRGGGQENHPHLNPLPSRERRLGHVSLAMTRREGALVRIRPTPGDSEASIVGANRSDCSFVARLKNLPVIYC